MLVFFTVEGVEGCGFCGLKDLLTLDYGISSLQAI